MLSLPLLINVVTICVVVVIAANRQLQSGRYHFVFDFGVTSNVVVVVIVIVIVVAVVYSGFIWQPLPLNV